MLPPIGAGNNNSSGGGTGGNVAGPSASADRPSLPTLEFTSNSSNGSNAMGETSELLALRTRVSELELVNDLFRSRVSELEASEAAVRRDLSMRREVESQLRMCVDEFERREIEWHDRVRRLGDELDRALQRQREMEYVLQNPQLQNASGGEGVKKARVAALDQESGWRAAHTSPPPPLKRTIREAS